MSEAGPVQLALRSLWRQPSLVLAEIAWRWLYLLAAAAVIVFTTCQILDSVELSPAESVLAGLYRVSLAGILAARALPLAWGALCIVVPAFALLWVGLASVSRAAILGALPGTSPAGLRPNWSGLIGIHFLRALLAIAAVISWAGALILSFSFFPVVEGQSPRTAALLLWLAMGLLIWLAWSFLDWFLRLSPIFAVRNGRGVLAAVDDAIVLLRCNAAACLSTNSWFGFWRFGLFVVISALALVAVTVAGPSPISWAIALVLVLLAYSAASSFLYIMRLAAYVNLSRFPSSPEGDTGSRTALRKI